MLLLLNLHVTTDKGSLNFECGRIMAQVWLEETLPEVVVIGSQYTTCTACYMTVEKRNLQMHLEQDCPKRTVECAFCGQTYVFCNGHSCTATCALCHKPASECTCNGCTCNGNNNSGNSSGNNGNNGNVTGSSSSSSSGGPSGNTSSSEHKTTIAKQDEAVKKAVELMKQKYGNKMACNIGVQYVAQTLFGSIPSTLKGSADDIYLKISSSSAWQQISAEQAGQYANEGYFVVGIWYGPTGNPPSDNGHIVLVRPTTDGKVEVMDTGSGNGYESGKPGKRERQSINQSFRQTRRGQVKYFYYK